jgi:hypothetical protein
VGGWVRGVMYCLRRGSSRVRRRRGRDAGLVARILERGQAAAARRRPSEGQGARESDGKEQGAMGGESGGRIREGRRRREGGGEEARVGGRGRSGEWGGGRRRVAGRSPEELEHLVVLLPRGPAHLPSELRAESCGGVKARFSPSPFTLPFSAWG